MRAAVEEGILVKGGGHAMAAGLTVMRDQLGPLRGFFDGQLEKHVKAATAKQQLKIDGALTARSATIELVEMLERAGPYGQSNPQPLFAFPSHKINNVRIVGADHVSFTASAGDGAHCGGSLSGRQTHPSVNYCWKIPATPCIWREISQPIFIKAPNVYSSGWWMLQDPNLDFQGYMKDRLAQSRLVNFGSENEIDHRPRDVSHISGRSIT